MKRFTDEHVVPRSLGGSIILKEASCNACAATINSGFEAVIAKQVMGDVHHKYGNRSRHRKAGKGAPTTKLVRSVYGWNFEVPLSQYPSVFLIHDFGTATLITGKPDPELERNGWWNTYIKEEINGKEKYASFIRNYPHWDRLYTARSRPREFARLAAKIAYGTAVCYLGADGFDEEITPTILGIEPAFSRAVGGGREGYINNADPELGFSFKVIPIDDQRFRLIMDYKMFQGSPDKTSYHVVLGTIDLNRSLHLKTLEIIASMKHYL